MDEVKEMFLKDSLPNASNLTVAILDQFILDDECFYVSYELIKDSIDHFEYIILLLTNKRIIRLKINDDLVNLENFFINRIYGFEIIEDYCPDEATLKSLEGLQKIRIMFKDNNYVLELEPIETPRLAKSLQIKKMIEFIKKLNEIIL